MVPATAEPVTASRNALLRVAVAIAIGLSGAISVWLLAPYTFYMRVSVITDDMLSVATLFFMLILVLGVNLILRRLVPRWALDFRQLALASTVMLAAVCTPSSGLTRMAPYWMAQAPYNTRQNKALAEAMASMNLPQSLFPDPLGFRAATPYSDTFIRQLPEGDPIPWGAWARPALAWGAFFLACYMMMLGLAGIVFPQWRDNERLPFTLIALQQSLIEDPRGNALLPPLLRTPSFWFAAGTVFSIYLLEGLNLYHPQTVPRIPIRWSVGDLFTEPPLLYMPAHVYQGRLYFIFIGMAFFAPPRVSLSIPFFHLSYAVYVIVKQAYFPSSVSPYVLVQDHRTGAMMAATVGIVWLGRAHWGHVMRCMVFGSPSAPHPAGRRGGLFFVGVVGVLCAALIVQKAPSWWPPLVVGLAFAVRSMTLSPGSEEHLRDRRSGVLFLLGVLGMVAFQVWVGVQTVWAFAWVGFAFMFTILLARIVSETGIGHLCFYPNHMVDTMRLFPVAWLNPVSVWFQGFIGIIFALGGKVCATMMALQAIGLDRRATPRVQWRILLLLLVLVMAGAFISGAVHVQMNYRHSATADGKIQPLAAVTGTPVWYTQYNEAPLIEHFNGKFNEPIHSRLGHMAFGAALAAFLQWACLALPTWPIHPLGLLIVFTGFSIRLWVSVFIGWLAQRLLVRYGGSRVFQKAHPLFLGLIMGEVLASVFWMLVSVTLVAGGKEPIAYTPF